MTSLHLVTKFLCFILCRCFDKLNHFLDSTDTLNQVFQKSLQAHHYDDHLYAQFTCFVVDAFGLRSCDRAANVAWFNMFIVMLTSFMASLHPFCPGQFSLVTINMIIKFHYRNSLYFMVTSRALVQSLIALE